MDGASIALVVLVLPHLIGGAFLAWWILPASAKHELRGWFRDDGGEERPSGRPDAPVGGGGRSNVPLPDAAPAAVRMREPGRLGDGRPVPRRRPQHPVEPERHRDPQPR
jgi:hypothetical protein